MSELIIDKLLFDIEELAHSIVNSSAILDKIDHESDAYKTYATQLLDIINEYDSKCDHLNEVLEKYFKEEEKNSNIVSLKYKKLHKNLNLAIKLSKGY